jgi:type IV pilus assembly protein PilC
MAKTLDYEYAVRDRSGKMVRGKLKAESPAVVATRLKSMGYAPVSITQANAGLNRELSIPGFGNKVGLKDLAIMSRQFATMVNSGLSLLRALTILEEQTECKPLAKVLTAVRGEVEAGKALSAAMSAHPRSSRPSWSTCAVPVRSAGSWTAPCCRSRPTTRPRSSCAAR